MSSALLSEVTHMNQADTAWMLMSTALVLLMTPALAFFYGGLVRSKNALNTMMMSFISLGFVGVLWALLGYSLAFTAGNAWIGDLSNALLQRRRPRGQGHDSARALHGLSGHVRHHHRRADLRRDRRAHALLGLCGVHLAVGARRLQPDRALGVGRRLARAVGRARFRRRHRRARQRRGRRASSRRSSSASARDYRSSSLLPHNVPFVLLGAGLLWFGWFGFNAGSALAASPIAGLAFVTTMLAPAATLVVWTFLDVMRSGKPTAVGAATAIVVGLVAITPAAGFISPMNAILLGGIAAVPSYFALQFAREDVARRFARRARRARRRRNGRRAADRRIRGEGAQRRGRRRCSTAIPRQLLIQGAAVLAALVYSGGMSFVLLKLIEPGAAACGDDGGRNRRSRRHAARRRGVHPRRRRPRRGRPRRRSGDAPGLVAEPASSTY